MSATCQPFDVLPRVEAGRLEGAGLPFDCQGDKYNCSIVDPLEIWVWSRRGGVGGGGNQNQLNPVELLI